MTRGCSPSRSEIGHPRVRGALCTAREHRRGAPLPQGPTRQGFSPSSTSAGHNSPALRPVPVHLTHWGARLGSRNRKPSVFQAVSTHSLSSTSRVRATRAFPCSSQHPVNCPLLEGLSHPRYPHTDSVLLSIRPGHLLSETISSVYHSPASASVPAECGVLWRLLPAASRAPKPCPRP